MTFWDIIGWLVIGLIAGWIASMVMGRGGYGVVGDIVVGLIGAFIGGLVARLLNIGGPSASDPISWVSLIFAIIGAIILIAILRAVSGGRARA
ncbi:MAG: GlsB/YeaQ/YmgE family stress response membrane protein [Chloroflexota bacterium]